MSSKPFLLSALSTSSDSGNGEEVTDLYLVHSNMAILNLVSQVRTSVLSYSILFYTLLTSSHLISLIDSAESYAYLTYHTIRRTSYLLCHALP